MKKLVLMLSVLFIVACGGGGSSSGGSLGINLVALANWFQTQPNMSVAICGASGIRFQIVFRNVSGAAIQFSPASASTFQIWSVPGTIPPVTFINTSPAGATIPANSTFSYDFVVTFNALPATETGIAIRPVSLNLGTMSPAIVPLQNDIISCS